MPRDSYLLFSTRIIRLFAYGFVSVVLALYLVEVGLTEQQVGVLFTFTLIGDACISLWLTTTADRIGRRKMLLISAGLMILAGVGFLLTGNPFLLTMAAIVGVISPSGNEIGPFLSIEQASLTQLIPGQLRTHTFAWYNLVGSFSTATGALVGGWLAQTLKVNGMAAVEAYRVVLVGYALAGVAMMGCFLFLSPAVEVGEQSVSNAQLLLGLHKSRGVVVRLSSLFALDAFAGGLIIQSMMAFWFFVQFNVNTGVIGSIFFGANILAGISALLSVRIAARIGLINTMVFTHIPSNILLMLVPLMPNLTLAITVLLLRFSISQMDVPTRQSYTMAVVAPYERSAASGVTGIARSLGAAIAPSLTGMFLGIPALISVPFFLSGGLKIVYDLLLYQNFRSITPPEERE
jgi:MFS family permease